MWGLMESAPIRIVLDHPSRSLWVSRKGPRTTIRLQDGATFGSPIPLETSILRQMATGMPLECAFWSEETGDRLTLKWEGMELVALLENEHRTVREIVDVESLQGAAELLG